MKKPFHSRSANLALATTVMLALTMMAGSNSLAARSKSKAKTSSSTATSEQTEESDDSAAKLPTKLPSKLPTKLPAFTGTKRITVDFNSDSGERPTTVVVRTPLPLEKALEDEKAAAKAHARNKKKRPSMASEQVDESFSEMLHDLSPEGAVPDSVKVVEQAEPSAPLPKKPIELPAKVVAPSALPNALPTKPLSKPAQLLPSPSLAPVLAPPSASVPVVAREPAPLPPMESAPVPLPVPLAPVASTSDVDDSNAPEFVGPPAPPVVVKTQSREALPAAAVSNEPPLAPAIIQVTRAPQPTVAPQENSNPSEWRLELRGSYLNAKYSELESRLSNGATALGLGVRHRIPSLAMTSEAAILEGRLAIDVLHGLDQSVTPENIRMVLVRGDVMAFVPLSFVADVVTPYVSGGLGYATYSVRSVRSVDGNTLTVRRHASGSALALIPALGARVRLSTDLSLDLQAEYLALLGGESSASVGGLGVNAAVGFKF